MGQFKSFDITHSRERSPGRESGQAHRVLERHYFARRCFSSYWSRRSVRAIAKQLFDPFFLAYIAVWLTVHGFRYFHYPLPYLNGWLTDFVFLPAVAHFTRTCTRHFVLQGRQFIYPLHWLIMAAVYCGLLCEWILPKYVHHMAGDLLDALAYIGGAFFFYYIHQKNDRTRNPIRSNFEHTYPKAI